MADHLNEIVACLADLPGSDRLFNPYSSQADERAAIRRANLLRYLGDMAARQPRSLFLFEAPGYRGCALTGIPVTSERIMLAGIPEWNLFGKGYYPTSGHPQGVAEMTATILWGALREHLEAPPLIWNTVPLHPHRPGEPRSNRPPRRPEVEMGLPVIEMILQAFHVERVFAVGRVAGRALGDLGRAFIPLRHPSQGGKAEFIRGLTGVHQ
ncbi:MAG: uracil-DNA glycosylase [Anaerolineae bacterium]